MKSWTLSYCELLIIIHVYCLNLPHLIIFCVMCIALLLLCVQYLLWATMLMDNAGGK